jgi:hypothetical protein
VDATHLNVTCIQLFQASPEPVNFLSVYQVWNGAEFRFLNLPCLETCILLLK